MTVSLKPRIMPREKPYPENIGKILSAYPQGPDGPINLFRTLAHSERALKKIGQAGLLDKRSPLSIKNREIVILRTSANLGSDYEWGIHILSFSERAGLNSAQKENTCAQKIDTTLWTSEEIILLSVSDSLCKQADLNDELWDSLNAVFSLEQIIEILMLAGFYHTIAFLNNTLRIEQEQGAPAIDKPS